MDGFGRKTVLVFCQVLAGTTCIIAAFIDNDVARITLTLAGIYLAQRDRKYKKIHGK